MRHRTRIATAAIALALTLPALSAAASATESPCKRVYKAGATYPTRIGRFPAAPSGVDYARCRIAEERAKARRD